MQNLYQMHMYAIFEQNGFNYNSMQLLLSKQYHRERKHFFLALVSLYQEKKYPRPAALRNTYSGPPFENFFQCALISLPLLLDMVCFLQLCQVLQSQLIKLLTAWFPSFIFADSVYSA